LGLFSECKQMVKYSGTSIEIATVKGPVQVPVEVSGVAIKPQLLQAASAILQILDWLQYSACQRIHELKKLKEIPQKTVAELILRQDEDARMIAYLAIISITACNSPENFEKVLADWIAAALPRVTQQRAVSLYTYDERKLRESRCNLQKLEDEIMELDDKIKELSRQLRKLKSRRDKLNEERRAMHLLLEARLPLSRMMIDINLEQYVAEAISAFPYLSEALAEHKPFDIERSLKTLQSKE